MFVHRDRHGLIWGLVECLVIHAILPIISKIWETEITVVCCGGAGATVLDGVDWMGCNAAWPLTASVLGGGWCEGDGIALLCIASGGSWCWSIRVCIITCRAFMSLHAIIHSLVASGKDSNGVYLGDLLAMVLAHDRVTTLRDVEGGSGWAVLLICMAITAILDLSLTEMSLG